ncbi:DUF1320 family protein [Sinomicrobium kalidii]|uniref:phage protein Gp36 family protein n=1 Tax=Sinomicrobium kalidii TaxID=2900738 RepID=UPI001E2F5111|nr:phage protein Gp36 family protein [Sinomicrobium kalidii]UGU15205.1 DUF1320 family protein [Sinomicrobium kalidii]
MTYLDPTYIQTHIFQRLLVESTADFTDMLDNAEAEQIAVIKSYLSHRYDVNRIFNPDQPVENELLKRILTKLLIYDAVRRNAARKVPADFKDEQEWAMNTLEKLNTGKIILDNLPPAIDDNGNPLLNTIWGHNSNPDFYL